MLSSSSGRGIANGGDFLANIPSYQLLWRECISRQQDTVDEFRCGLARADFARFRENTPGAIRWRRPAFSGIGVQPELPSLRPQPRPDGHDAVEPAIRAMP